MTSVVAGTFVATGSSAGLIPVTGSFSIPRNMNISLSGTFTATVLVERSFDGGTTYHLVDTHTAIVETNIIEQETSVLYRLRCSAYTDGTVVYRLSA